MKKIMLITSLSVALFSMDELPDILSENKSKILNYQKEKNQIESDKLQKSWISPIVVSYKKNYSEQLISGRVDTGSFSIGIDQPIFKSGGIYFAIKYADAIRGLNGTSIEIQKRAMIGNALSILYNLKKLALNQKKLRLLVKNDNIDILQKRDSYDSGLIDSSFLDQSILKKNSDEIQLLDIELSIQKLKNDFYLLSDKNPSSIKLPKLKLIKESRYKGKNLELVKEKFAVREKSYSSKMTWTKYLPTISIQARYTDSDPSAIFVNPNLKEAYNSYGFTISMPISINSLRDIESSKVSYMEAETKLMDKKKDIENEYKLVLKNLAILDKKISLSKKDEKLYKSLYKSTKNLQKAGEKTKLDTELMGNSLKIKKYDQQIYRIDKELQLLSLYIKVH
jgi:outer membrane protein TolC